MTLNLGLLVCCNHKLTIMPKSFLKYLYPMPYTYVKLQVVASNYQRPNTIIKGCQIGLLTVHELNIKIGFQ